MGRLYQLNQLYLYSFCTDMGEIRVKNKVHRFHHWGVCAQI